MSASMQSVIGFFGSAIEQDNAKKVRKDIFSTFRRPFIKKNITTHGPLWCQYAFPGGVISICDVNIDKDTKGYIFIEEKGRYAFIFSSTLEKFIHYLKSRDDGLFPAVYFIDNDFIFCLGENGERGSMKPIYIYSGMSKNNKIQ